MDAWRRASERVGWGWLGAGDVFRRGGEFHGDAPLGDHFADVRADHVRAPRCRSVWASASTLTNPSASAVTLARAVGRERELADLVGDAGGLEFLLV